MPEVILARAGRPEADNVASPVKTMEVVLVFVEEVTLDAGLVVVEVVPCWTAGGGGGVLAVDCGGGTTFVEEEEVVVELDGEDGGGCWDCCGLCWSEGGVLRFFGGRVGWVMGGGSSRRRIVWIFCEASGDAWTDEKDSIVLVRA